MNIDKKNIINNTPHETLKSLGREDNCVELTKDQIIFIHDDGIKNYGGIYGIRDEGLLDSICSSPYQSIFGTDLYPTIFDKAAKYLFDFAHYQVFLDGNKRTGLTTAIAFLNINGFNLELTPTETYNLTMHIANNILTEIKDISKILEDNSIIMIGKTVIDNKSELVKEEEEYEGI